MTATDIQRFQASGADPHQASLTYGDAYGGRFVARPDSSDFAFRYATLGDDRVTLRTSTCTGTLSGEVPHLRDYVVSWFRDGSGRLDRLRGDRRSLAADPFLLPSEESFAVEFAPHRQHLVHFAQQFLEDVATELHAGPRQRVAFDLEAAVDRGMLARWRGAVTVATAAIVSAATAPLLRLNAELGLARALLALFPWRVWDVPAVLRESANARTRIALDFMQHHAHEPITVVDAAAAAGLHTRTLQLATRQHLGLSPSTYLRNVRLDRVQADLAQREPGDTTVTATARAWGFGNLGRFASTYQMRFGEKPSETLRR